MASKPYEPPLSEGVRKCMKSNKSKGTSPELRLRKALRDAGYPGYRVNWKKAPGKPDICYPGRKVAIFVNGCFWHRCPHCDLPLPKHNSEYWIPKLERNVERDRENRDALRAEGWTVVDVWGCEMKSDFDGCVRRAVDAIEKSG
ncbi:MAG: very short patch repair endonuclease [Thermoplasmata archaeon]|nr:very short patch repair endonuclease [Thermoplasmata archaeon]